jgi:tetratricopeptide (TPR) repeat protein
VTGLDDARRSAMQAALQHGVDQLHSLELQPSTRSLARLALRLQKERDPEKALDSFGRLARELRHLQEVVDSVYERGLAAEYEEAQRFPYERSWLAYRRRKLEQFEKPAEWAQHWLDDWMDAVAHPAWPAALAIIEWRHLVGAGVDDLRAEMRSIVHDMRAGRPPTISAVDRLMGVRELSEATRIRIHVLKARTLRYLGNPQEAAELMKETARFARGGDPAIIALVQAVRAEIALAVNNLDAAKRYVDGAAPVDDDEISDRMVVAGQIALAEQDWTRASNLFDNAARRFGPSVAEARLLGEVPPNLVLAVARSLREQDPPAAVEQYDRAIGAGLEGPDTERRLALREYAEVLARLGRSGEAAAAYARAADLYPDPGSQRELLKRAHELDPDNANYCWSLGELLRFQATDINGTIADPEQLRRAGELLEQGARIAGPAALPGWVMVSIGLAAHSLGTHPDPALWLERGLLRDGPNANNCALLAWLHRLDGFAQAAERAARFGADDRLDPFLASQWILPLIDLGRYDEASQVVDDADLTDTDSAVWRSWIACRSGQPEAGIDVLKDADDGSSPSFSMIRLACYEMLGDDDRAREVAAQTLQESNAHEDDTLGRAEYLLDRLDDAVDRLERLYERAPQYHSGAQNLGLALLVRGNPTSGDVDRGRTILLNAIVHSYSADELLQLLQIHLGQAAQKLVGRPHEEDGRAALDEAREAAEARAAELRTREPKPELLSQQLATARQLRARGQLAAAIRRYAKLSQADGVPEAATVMRKVACELTAAGDEELTDGNSAAAYTTWQGVAAALTSADPAASAPDDLAARLGFSELARGGVDDIEAVTHLRAACTESLVRTVPLFASSLDLAWQHHDGLLVLAKRVPPEQQAKFKAAAAAVPFDGLLRLNSSDVASHAFSPSAQACEIFVGQAHADQEVYFAEQIRLLRERVKHASGLLIPGVRFVVSSDHSDASVTFRVFEQVVAQFELEPGHGAGPAIMDRFADIAADNLFRWISFDDLELWNSGWNLNSEPMAELPEDLSDRVRLTQVLQSLLSEGIPIADRSAIINGFHAGTGPESTGESVSMITAVRRRLYPTIKAPGGERIFPVPVELEDATGSALDASRTIMARDRAHELRDALRGWRAEALPEASVTISVRETALRPFIWHLLSPERPRVFVVAEEEIADTEQRT